jgi:hypothetical protein
MEEARSADRHEVGLNGLARAVAIAVVQLGTSTAGRPTDLPFEFVIGSRLPAPRRIHGAKYFFFSRP